LTASSQTPDFRGQIERLRAYLLRYASLQLRNPEAAEDAVQETLLAALAAGEAAFGGRSNLRTWLTGILKHKLVDAIRRQSRERPPQEFDRNGETEFDSLFDSRGHWQETPDAWEQPEESLQQKQFLAALEACLAALPQRTSRVFMMREHLGLETSEICKELGITATHCWVMLHRARMSLRLCLEKNWFAKS
jgi:RNA polymerase sigma-70 factor (ECF subfamily)